MDPAQPWGGGKDQDGVSRKIQEFLSSRIMCQTFRHRLNGRSSCTHCSLPPSLPPPHLPSLCLALSVAIDYNAAFTGACAALRHLYLTKQMHA
jgi:hypothetical protein